MGRNKDATTTSRSRGAFRTRALLSTTLYKDRGRREGRVTAAPGALAPERLREGRVTTGTGGDTPAFPAQWCYGLYALSSVKHPVCHRHPRDDYASSPTCRQISGAPGPPDSAVRIRAARQQARPRPP